MTRNNINKLLREKTGRPRTTLELHLKEIGADKLTAAETAAELNRLLGTSLSAKNLHNLVKWMRSNHSLDFSFRDSRGRRTSAEENAMGELRETIRQLTPGQRLSLLGTAKGLRATA